MQNDLISRSALLEIFNHDLKCFETGKKAEKEMYISVADMRKMISEQPTAYDVDKVVEQLEEQKEVYSPVAQEGYFKGKVAGLCDAIDIVKRGGVDD